MSKEAEKTAAPQGPSPENLAAMLRRLHREYLASVRELAADGERRVGAALEGCMSEMAKIEDEAATGIRNALAECEAAQRAAKDAPTSAAYWDYQRKTAEARAAAGSRADVARKSYLDAWKSAVDDLEQLRRKARIDYLARVQQAWRTADVEKLDPATAEMLVLAFDTVFTDTALG
jgi:hypothetical protein